MDRIIFELDDASARLWRNASDETKHQFNDTVNLLIKTSFEKSKEDFLQFMDRVGKKAIKNGLTQEILDELLKHE